MDAKVKHECEYWVDRRQCEGVECGICTDECELCRSLDAIKRNLHPSQSDSGASRDKSGKPDAPIDRGGPSKLPRDFP